MIRLSQAKCFKYAGVFRYIISYDYAAGLPERYTVLIPNAADPVVIGRELDLKTVRSVIRDYEEEGAKLPCYIGERKDILLVQQRVKEIRRKRYG